MRCSLNIYTCNLTYAYCVFPTHQTPGWYERGRGHGSKESSSAGEEAEEGEGGSGEKTTAGPGPGAEEGSWTVCVTFLRSVYLLYHLYITVPRFMASINALCLLNLSVQPCNKSLSWSPPVGWKPRRSCRRRMTRRKGGNTSGMNTWGRSSSSWWWKWTTSSSPDLEVSRKSHGPSPSTGTSWSRPLRLWEHRVSNTKIMCTNTLYGCVAAADPCCCVAGVRPRGFSVSSVSLASLNLADNDRDQPNNRKNNR